MFLVKVAFAQNGVWSKPYDYLCTQEVSDHVVVPTGGYMSVGVVTSCQPLGDTVPSNLKYIYGRVSYDLFPSPT